MAIKANNLRVLNNHSLHEIEQLLQWQRRTGSRTMPATAPGGYVEGPDPETVPIYNADAAAVPQFGIMELGALRSDGVVFSAAKPAYSSISRFGIACTPIASGATGRVWVLGRHVALITLLPGETVSIRDHVRPHAGSFYGRLFSLGPMIVESVISTTAVVVTITEERGDHKIADTQGQCDGPYQAFVFSSAYTVGAGTIGKPTVDTV